MAEDIVIRAEGLGKKYRIGHEAERERYVALRDVLARGAKSLWRKTADMALGRPIVSGATVEEVWALKDVSFEVRRGEALGIIGRNGAGKSTLLKILSRITEPSAGRVTIKGRVASLLEVGTGFHPELTGRENIYLNGAILGMTRAEVRRKFDEIVAFAEVEKFLDTPVKRYSSGMYVRLAFAVAAHLEPEILLVDEVLAVGDVEFQKKCLGKMSDVAGGGRTILFVSHHMGAIRALCSEAVLLEAGEPPLRDTAARTVERYLQRSFGRSGREWDCNGSAMPGDDTLKIRKVAIKSPDDGVGGTDGIGGIGGIDNIGGTDGADGIGGTEGIDNIGGTDGIGGIGGTDGILRTDTPFSIAIEYEQRTRLQGVRISIQLVAAFGEIVFTATDHSARSALTDGAGPHLSTCRIPGYLLNAGRYTIRLSVDVPGVRVISDWREIGVFNIVGAHNGGTSFPDGIWPGVVSPRLSWLVA